MAGFRIAYRSQAGVRCLHPTEEEAVKANRPLTCDGCGREFDVGSDDTTPSSTSRSSGRTTTGTTP